MPERSLASEINDLKTLVKGWIEEATHAEPVRPGLCGRIKPTLARSEKRPCAS
jgi:hypothetical protein